MAVREVGFSSRRGSTAEPYPILAILDTVQAFTFGHTKGVIRKVVVILVVCALGAVPALTASAAGALSAPNCSTAVCSATAKPGSNTVIVVRWGDSNTRESGYSVERSTAGSSGPFAVVGSPTRNATTFENTGLTPGTTYWYRVRARGRQGAFSPYSPVLTGRTTGGAPADTKAPSTPANVAASVQSCTSVKITWTASTDNVGVTGYRLLRNNAVVATVGPSPTSYTHTATASSTVSYTVIAFDAANNASSASTPASATTPACPNPTPAGAFVRAQRFGGSGSQGDAGYGIATNRGDGSVALTGEFTGTANFGGASFVSAGSSDAVVAKYTAAGAHQWSRSFGGTKEDRGQAIAFDGNGDVFVAGEVAGTVNFGGGPVTTASNSRDAFLAKYNGATGALLWAKTFGVSYDDYANAIAIDPRNGNVVIAGMFANNVDFGGGVLVSDRSSSDIFVASYTTNGAYVMSKRFGGSAIDGANGVAVDKDGGIALVGTFMGLVDFGAGPVRSNDGSSDGFAVKLRADGTHIWSRTFGDEFGDDANDVAIDGSGNVVVTGSFRLTADFGGGPITAHGNSPSDLFLAKYSSTGAYQWARNLGGPNMDSASGVALDGHGNVVVTGYFQDTADFGAGARTSAGSYDVIVGKYAAQSGALQWSKTFGSADADYGIAVAVDNQDRTFVTGAFAGTVDFGGGPITSAGGRDAYIAVYGP